MTGVPADERPEAADDSHPAAVEARVYFHPMSPGTDNQVDWTAAATPQGDRLVSSLSRPQPQPRVTPQTKRSVMDTLLGENSLAAVDIGGGDPYNATGRQFRR
jgi:hypothetical protein